MVPVPREYRKLFQDSIVVTIPLDVTVDLGIAVKRTREKRIKAIYEHFPALKAKEEAAEEEAKKDAKEELDSEDDDENKESRPQTPQKKKKKNEHIPQRHQYGSVMDYLEAKYVRGVVFQDNDEKQGGDNEEEDDEKRSVYDSESSFLDDSLLKRDVAEQILSHTTQTKLEVENDDGDFFVNVGTLEVEDHDLMDYDPVEDEKSKKKRKRTPSLDSKTSSKKSKPAKKQATGSSTEKGKAQKDSQKKSPAKKKPATPKSSSKSQDEGKIKPDPVISEERKEQIAAHKQRAGDLKAEADRLFQKTKDLIEAMTDKELPKRKKTEKVSITLPSGKNPGDEITFSNPHNPGQKLRVKVPEKTSAGGKFVVSVPVANTTDPDVDANKFNRAIQETLDEYSHAYDDWCHAESAYRELDPTVSEKFQLHHERMNKFQKIIKIFPDDLVTPIDGTYLRKIVRRARQNKHKRTKTAQKMMADMPDTAQSSSPTRADPPASSNAKATGSNSTSAADDSKDKTTFELHVPGKGTSFPEVQLGHDVQ